MISKCLGLNNESVGFKVAHLKVWRLICHKDKTIGFYFCTFPLILFSNFRLYVFKKKEIFSHALSLEHRTYLLWSKKCLHRMVISFYTFLCAWIPLIYPSFCREIRPRHEWNSHNYLQSFFSLLLYFKVDRFFLSGKPSFASGDTFSRCVFAFVLYIHHRAMSGIEREEFWFHS